MTQFVHLHVHSEYSVVDSTLGIKPLMALVQGCEQPAMALTDQNNLFALVKFYKAAMGAGIKPIIGSEVFIEDENGEVFIKIPTNEFSNEYLFIINGFSENGLLFNINSNLDNF